MNYLSILISNVATEIMIEVADNQMPVANPQPLRRAAIQKRKYCFLIKIVVSVSSCKGR